MREIATAARDQNKNEGYNLWGEWAVLLLPEEVDEEDDEEVIVGPDEAAEE